METEHKLYDNDHLIITLQYLARTYMCD